MIETAVYCEALTPHIAWRIARRFGAKHRIRGRRQVQVLDALRWNAVERILAALLRACGIDVVEVPFFAGHLRMTNGEAVWLAARRLAAPIALDSARLVIGRSRRLRRIAARWGQPVVLKCVASAFQAPATDVAMCVFTADALRRAAGNRTAHVVLRTRRGIDPAQIVPSALTVECVGHAPGSWRSGRVALIGKGTALRLRYFMRSLRGLVEAHSTRAPLATGSPSLLLLQEDDLSMDRSYRSQPHWLFPEGDRPPYEIIVLCLGKVARLEHSAQDLMQAGVKPIFDNALPPEVRRAVLPGRLRRKLKRTQLDVLSAAFSTDDGEIAALAAMGPACEHARHMARIVIAGNVRAVAVAENYFPQADALLLIAPVLGIKTVSFQYSNRLIPVVPAMLTTADVMVTLAPAYNVLWTASEVQPRQFCSAGYVYDASFPLLRARAMHQRSQLLAAGAEFVVCYFDESVQTGKYGLISESDHIAELRYLLERVCDEPGLAVITKSQFERNSPYRFPQLRELVERAAATGRYVDLRRGVHRNVVFAAEAAMAADIIIGHACGATAALEGALAGTRSVLLDPYRIPSEVLNPLRVLDVMYPSLEAAFDAIAGWRRGAPERSGLGDWSSALPVFDPFRDGQAPRRLRRVIDDAMGVSGNIAIEQSIAV